MSKPTYVLGISAFYHDSAAALVRDGAVVAAAQEERFSRRKHDADFPTRAVEYCLAEAGIDGSQIDYVGFYEKPMQKFDRLIETYLAFAPRGFGSFAKAVPLWLRQKLHLPREMSRGLGGGYDKRFVFCDHHESHAASAFFPSPFEEAAILTMDAVGEWATASYGTGNGNRIRLGKEMRFPHSIGLLYSAFTYYCGFEVNSGEYKLMGLAPYGEPEYADLIRDKLIDLRPDGSFWLDQAYFNYCQGLTMTSQRFHELFGGPPRGPEEDLTQRHMNLAASIQSVTEEIVLRAARHVHAETGMNRLCLAGGVALNCVANGRLLREGPFEEIWVQPAAGDAGGALGIALFIWHQLLGRARTLSEPDAQSGSLLGPEFSDQEILDMLEGISASYQHLPDAEVLADRIAGLVAEGKVVGLFQDRMEFGPRALGSRSIIGDARNEAMQSIINRKVKFREGFRPFAPAVLQDRASSYFDVDATAASPYMLFVAPVAESRRLPLSESERDAHGFERLQVPRSEIPAVTHVNDSARLQTVDRQRHPGLHRILETFARRTGCPVLVNTSFNLSWEPIVCTPLDAYRTYMASQIDALAIGSFLLEKPSAARSASDGDSSAGATPRFAHLEAGWACPRCLESRLSPNHETVVCGSCQTSFPISNGIPQLFWPHESIDEPGDVTAIVKGFYEETPFPNYNEHDSVRSLIEKARKRGYAAALDRTVPYEADVLEVGCGTGQLSNFLGVAQRRVVGADLCLNSLKLAEGFRRDQQLSNVRFVQMNLFRPCLEIGRFETVMCNGVLHSTSDPEGGFRSIARLVKPGGHIIIGLYNSYGRFFTNMRRGIFKLTGGRGQWLDPYLRSFRLSPDKQLAWYRDQYEHPHESQHTIGEVLKWFDRAGIEFVRGIPNVSPFEDDLADDLFEPTPRGNALEHFLVEFRELCRRSQEGGFFVMIGRVPEDGTALQGGAT